MWTEQYPMNRCSSCMKSGRLMSAVRAQREHGIKVSDVLLEKDQTTLEHHFAPGGDA